MSRVPALLALGALLLTTTGCGRSGSEPWPELSVDHLDQDVRAQLAESRAAAEAVRNDGTGDPDARVSAFAEHAMDLHCYERFEDAAFFYGRARDLAPDDPKWAHLSGLALARAGRSDEAAEAFRVATQLDDSAIGTWLHLGFTELERGLGEEARRAFERALELEPDSVSALWGLGRLDLEADRPLEAVERLKRAISIDPSAGAVHYSLGLAYRNAGDDANAERHFELRNDRTPAIPDPLAAEVRQRGRGLLARLNRGKQLSQQGRFDEAQLEFEAVLARDPDHPIAHLYMGLVASRLGDPERARTLLARAETLAPNDERPSLFRGVLLAGSGRDVDALLAFERAIERAPDLVSARVERAKTLQRLGRLDEALAGFEEALRTRADTLEAHWGRFVTLVALGRHDDARAALEQPIALAPDQPAFRHALARLFAASPQRELRDGETALRIAEGLRKGGMQSVDLLETAAMALAESGRFAEAIQVQTGAVGVLSRGNAPTWARDVARKRLQRYESRRTAREPWAPEDPIFAPSPSPLTAFME